MHTPHRPSRGRTLAAGVAVGALLLAPASVVSADVPAEATDAASFVVAQLTDGDHVEGDFGVSYGPTTDVAFGLLAAESEPDAATAVLDFLSRGTSVSAYTQGGEFDGTTVEDPAYVGATAKLGFLLEVADRDPRDVAGTDLVAQLLSLEVESGRFEDRSDHGNFANLLGHSFALLLLDARADVSPSAANVQALVDAQCDDGSFPEAFDGETCTGSVDTTGLAIQALLATEELVDVDQVLNDARGWLVAERDEDGAWGEPQNTNSTGYAGMGLDVLVQDVTASREFLRATQNDDGGLPLSPGGDSDVFATAQALPLLSGTSFLELVTGSSVPAPHGVVRAPGDDRLETAIATSQLQWNDGEADTVVLSRSDDFADALAGTPLAAGANGPLLLTRSTELDDAVLAEIRRVLPAGSDVHLLGGAAALSAQVERDVTDAGYRAVRVSGDTRYDTAVRIAEFLGDPDLLLVTTGLDFPDALSAGTVAAARGGAVLLSAGDRVADDTAAYLAGREDDPTVIAIGGPAAAAHPDLEPVVGDTRDETAVAVAERFFEAPARVGIARRDLFADALGGGVQAGRLGAPLLLTAPDALTDPTRDYLCGVADDLLGAVIWGGEAAISSGVADAVEEFFFGIGCGTEPES